MNAYLDFADSISNRKKPSHPKVVKSDRQAPMVRTGVEKALDERNKQVSRANKWDRAELERMLDGPHGPQIRQIKTLLRSLRINEGNRLLDLLASLDWLKANADVRHMVLSLIDDAIVELRICNGLPPIDDALPWEEPTIFQIVRSKLKPEETHES